MSGDRSNSRATDAVALDVIDPANPEAPQMMDRACREHGFFRVPAALASDGVVEAAWRSAAAFFDLSAEEKSAVAFPEPGYPYGYSPYEFETLAASLGDDEARPDLKESFSAGPDCMGPDWAPRESRAGGPEEAARPGWAEGEEWIRSPTLWPTEPTGFRQSWEACFQELSGISKRLLETMAIALDLPEDHFAPLINRHGGAMRALNYPAMNEAVPAGSLRASAHSDYGTLTILITDDVPGLEVQRRDGQWLAVTHVPETYIVNLGDSISRWTNDRWRSTVHRVTTVSQERRQSMAFFHMANWDAIIDCLPSCAGPGNPVRYEPVTAGPWLMEKFNRSIS